MPGRSPACRATTTRWNFEWGKYVVVGVPDGLKQSFVYELKTAGKRYFLPESQAQAFAQADLYGYFYGRPTKRVQIFVREDGGIETWEVPVDGANAERVLSTVDLVQRKAVTPELPPFHVSSETNVPFWNCPTASDGSSDGTA